MIIECGSKDYIMDDNGKHNAMTTEKPEKKPDVAHRYHPGLSGNKSRPGSMVELRGGIKVSKKPRGPGKTLATWSSQDCLHHRWGSYFILCLRIGLQWNQKGLLQSVKIIKGSNG